MSQNTNKINLPWTEEHEAFCYQHHIPPAAKSLWQWLIRQGEIASEIEPDLSQFNAWIEKHRGKAYSHNYLKQMFELLLNHRVVQVVKQYSWQIYKLLVRPLDWLKPRREKNLQNSNSSYNLQPSNDSNAVKESLQQQHSTNKQLLLDNGIYYDDDITQVLHRPTNEIKLAILIFILRGGFEEIKNPEGFIRDCLRGKWWEHPRNYNHLLQAYGNSTEWDELFPSG
ncbi:hypothetical protein I8752_25000 [Nostocaceae cyanobacterium CENA369]|uniref:Uncharacterized protein n=1 Tax=Dendronalium phyllosphericum CENA369 TaxID=1725256 RepID=A0A8J7LGE5_9NOST|nr:hypothetical protein [Dendronalium phyllosphericum]MBH8576191.1 hypothetical protein [Dendronalium phyllosphericum CENA369]